MFKRLKKLWSIIKYFYEDEDLLFLYLLKDKALKCMEDCATLDVSSIEELEDIIFHINTYFNIPSALIEIKYQEFRNLSVQDVIRKFKKNKLSIKEVQKYGDFLIDVETQRMLERDIIFDHAKSLPFGFSL